MFLPLHTISFRKRFSKHLLVKMVKKIAAGKKDGKEGGHETHEQKGEKVDYRLKHLMRIP